MVLTLQQIEQLTTEARATLSAAEADALREYLIDRAAQMDGATRLAMAETLLPDDEQRAAVDFQRSMTDIRGAIVARGTGAVSAISDAEWEGLINAQQNQG